MERRAESRGYRSVCVGEHITKIDICLWEKLRDLHPAANIDLNNCQDDEIIDKTDQLTVDTNVLSTVIASLPR